MATSLHDGWRGARGIKIMNPPCETLTSLATRAGRPFNQHQIPVCGLTATAGLASRARHDAAEAARLQAERDAVAQASRQALLSDLRRTGNAVHVRYLTLAVADQERRAAEAQADAKRLQSLLLRQIAEAAAKAIRSSAARRAPCCEEAAEQQRRAQEGKRTEPAACTGVHG